MLMRKNDAMKKPVFSMNSNGNRLEYQKFMKQQHKYVIFAIKENWENLFNLHFSFYYIRFGISLSKPFMNEIRNAFLK